MTTIAVKRGETITLPTGEEIMQALRTLRALEWIRISVGVNPEYGYLQVPYVAWRYHERTIKKERTNRETCTTTAKNVEWSLDTSRHNWLLSPSRLVDEQQAIGLPFSEAAWAIASTDQAFCLAANEDMALITLALGGKRQ
ncbi:hypothetical protein [Streptomyces sp. NPDC003077]|uniref:hypothetical protein n=1 Tax=Streptomyces sp. NPDC003077 TaxID=3154443 RepID=UPI0033AA96BB